MRPMPLPGYPLDDVVHEGTNILDQKRTSASDKSNFVLDIEELAEFKISIVGFHFASWDCSGKTSTSDQRY